MAQFRAALAGQLVLIEGNPEPSARQNHPNSHDGVEDNFKGADKFGSHGTAAYGCADKTLAQTANRVPAGRQSLTHVASVLAARREIRKLGGSACLIRKAVIRDHGGTGQTLTPYQLLV